MKDLEELSLSLHNRQGVTRLEAPIGRDTGEIILPVTTTLTVPSHPVA